MRYNTVMIFLFLSWRCFCTGGQRGRGQRRVWKSKENLKQGLSEGEMIGVLQVSYTMSDETFQIFFIIYNEKY